MSCTSEKWVPALFTAWENAGIQYVVLRNYENLPADTGNDLDLLVDSSRMQDAERLLIQVLREQGAVLHNRAEFSPISIFFHDPETFEQFHIDLFRDLKWRGFDLIPASHVLSRARRYRNMTVPSQPDEAVLNLITRLVFGGYVREKYKESIRTIFTEQHKEVAPILQRMLGTRSDILILLAQQGDWSAIEKMNPAIRKTLMIRALKNPFRVISSLLFDLYRLSARWISLPGLSLVLMGPDGCGKTSVGVELKKRLAGTFYEGFTRYLHWKPRLMGRKAAAANPFGTPCTNPHGKPSRHPVLNILYFLAHSLEIPPAWLLRVRPCLFRNMMVMIDRYYYDFMVDPKRYRMNVTNSWAWFMYRFMPKPDLVFCLTAPTAVIQARKKEVSPEETERQRLAYETVAQQLSYGHVIDTNRPLEQVVDEVEKIVLQYLAERTARK